MFRSPKISKLKFFKQLWSHACHMSRQSHPLSFNHPNDLINSMEQVLLDNLTGPQLMKKFPHFMEPECSLQYSQQPTAYPCLELDQSGPCHTLNSWRSILIFSSHLHLGLPSGLFPLGFPTKILYVPLPPHTYYMLCPSHYSGFDHLKNIWCGVQIIQLLIMQSSPLSCYVIPLRSIYLPQCPVLKHPQPTFPPHCERPVFTPTQNQRQIVVLYILIFMFLDSKVVDKRFCPEWQQAFLDFNPLLLSSLIQFWFLRAIPKYLNCLTH